MQALRKGLDYRATGRMQFPEGSFANGGAMRIAPVGLAYRHAKDGSLRQAVEAAPLCTHVHPEAIDGAVLQAKAVGLAATTGDPASFDPKELLQVLRQVSRTDIIQARLDTLIECLHHQDSDVYVIGGVGNGIRASQAVPAAIWAFVRYSAAPEECVIHAVNFGGDTDTIGAMAGALAGALNGRSWIPARWHDKIENGKRGRDEIVEVARRLARLDIA
jgi:poly(ADP-ribose) glycohydrolase ARH3